MTLRSHSTQARRAAAALLMAVVTAIAIPSVAGDPAADMEAARQALNAEQYQQAARLYAQAYEAARDAETAGNALYWEAFARYRLGGTDELRRAVALLAIQQENYLLASTAEEGEALAARIYGELAQRGEPDAAMEVAERAEAVRAETQMAALHALMQMDPQKAMPALEKIVRGEKAASPELRRNAIFMLCREGGERGEDLLIDLLRTATEPQLQSEIVMCLSMTQSDKALDAIVEFFRSTGDPQLSEEALFAIGRHGGDRAFTLLADMARNPTLDAEVRQQAVFALGQTGRDQETLRILLDMLAETKDPQLLEMALFSLANLDADVPEQVFLDLIRDPAASDELRAQALFFASQRDGVSLEFARETYRTTTSREVKQQVCHILTQMPDEDAALQTLIEIVRTETDPEIRRDAIFWVGQFDDPRAADFLLEILERE